MKRTTGMVTTIAWVAAWLVAVPEARSERLVVPLSDPSQPPVIQVQLVTGNITVEAYDGPDVIVEAERRQETDDVEEGGDVEDSGEPSTEGGLKRLPNTGFGFAVEEDDNRVQVVAESWKQPVDVSLRVPTQSSLSLNTVNQGEIRVRGVRGELELGNVNGPIEALQISGSVLAHTTNGEVRIELLAVTADQPMAFSSFNGNVDVTFPADLKAELRMRADNGDILTDFDVALIDSEPRVERQQTGGNYRVRVEGGTTGTVGGGGPEMRFQTFNGDVIVRRAQ